MVNLEKEHFFLMHSQKEEGKKRQVRVSVAALYDAETATMKFGVAKCFPQDNFCRKTGRELAIGRLALVGNKPTLNVNVPAETDLRNFFKTSFLRIEKHLKKNGLKNLQKNAFSVIFMQEPVFEMEPSHV